MILAAKANTVINMHRLLLRATTEIDLPCKNLWLPVIIVPHNSQIRPYRTIQRKDRHPDSMTTITHSILQPDRPTSHMNHMNQKLTEMIHI